MKEKLRHIAVVPDNNDDNGNYFIKQVKRVKLYLQLRILPETLAIPDLDTPYKLFQTVHLS